MRALCCQLNQKGKPIAPSKAGPAPPSPPTSPAPVARLTLGRKIELRPNWCDYFPGSESSQIRPSFCFLPLVFLLHAKSESGTSPQTPPTPTPSTSSLHTVVSRNHRLALNAFFHAPTRRPTGGRRK